MNADWLMELRDRFQYADGKLLVKKSGRWRGRVGEEAGTARPDGRRVVQFKGKRLFNHQIIWLIFNDDIPEGFTIDHEDRNPLNNRIENLRLATSSEQQGNKTLQSNNSSGYRGVSYCGSKNKSNPWAANIKHDGVTTHLGYFKTAEEAANAYNTAATKKFGAFASLNKV